mgnify:CR=1 FL=1
MKNTNSKFTQTKQTTVDPQRIVAAKKHTAIGNSFEQALREDIHNGFSYKAKNFLVISFYNNRMKEYQFLVCHDGEPFLDEEDLITALHFNLTRLGVQGIGAKAIIFALVKYVKDAKIIMSSKTIKDGEKSYMLSMKKDDRLDISEDTSNLSVISDVSNEHINDIKILLGDEYDKYNVFYTRRFDCDCVLSSVGKGNNNPAYINNTLNMQSLALMLSDDIKNNINIKYLDTFLDSLKPFESKRLVKGFIDVNDFVSKEFTIPVNKFTFTKKYSYGESIDYTLSGKIDLLVLPNIKSESDTHNMIINKNGFTSTTAKITEKSISKYSTFLTQSKLSANDNDNRSITEPIFVGNTVTNNLLRDLSIDPLGVVHNFGEIKKNSELIAVIEDYLVNKHNYDYNKYSAKPKIILKFHVEGVTSQIDVLGGLNNMFSALDDNTMRDIMKAMCNQARKDNGKELISCREYVLKLKKQNDISEYIPLYSSKKLNRRQDYEFITTEATCKYAKRMGYDYIPTKPNKKIGKVGLDVRYLPMRIKNKRTNMFLVDEDVVASNDGFEITKNNNPNKSKEGEFLLTVFNLFHKENGERIEHEIEEHKFRSKDYFPQAWNNDIYVDGCEKNVDLHIILPFKIQRKKPTKRDGDDKTSKPNNDIYVNLHETPDRLCKYDKSTKTLHLNTANPIISNLITRKDDKYTNLWNEIYHNMLVGNFVKEVYYGENEIDFYSFNANKNILESYYSDEHDWYLNKLVGLFLKIDSDCKKIADSKSLPLKDDDNVESKTKKISEIVNLKKFDNVVEEV